MAATPKDPADLSGMNPGQAKEYIWRHLASLKTLEKDIAAAVEPRDLWAKRVELAKAKGMADLQAAAEAELGKAQSKVDSLGAEARELKSLVERMRGNLAGVKARERSVDADYLLADMDLALGGDGSGSAIDKGATERAFDSMDDDAKLRALKRGMGMDAPEPEPPPAAEPPADPAGSGVPSGPAKGATEATEDPAGNSTQA